MGVYAGPDLKEDGLVLALDAGNYKNSRSSVSTNLVSNGSFANGVGSPNESGSNPTNTIVQLENPGETPFVLRQNGNNTEYQLNISGLTASTTYVMSGWYAKSSDYNGGDTMFHARTYSSSGAHIATGNDTGTLLRSITLGSTTWEYRYQTITTPSDSTGYMEWYVGYGTNNTTGYRYYTNLKIEKGTFPSLLNMVGDSNHGTPTNGLSYSSTNGGSLVFDGTNDGIELSGANLSLNQMTISSWNFSSNYAQNGFMFEKTTNGTVNTQYSLFFNGDNTIYYRTYGLSTTDLSINTTTAGVVNNQWNNVVATFDGTNKRIYVNGVLRTTSANLTGTVTQNSTGAAYIGIYGNFAGYPFNGRIAQTQIYNRALTASEIQQNFNATRSRFGI